MKSVFIISTAELYYGATASSARMILYARALATVDVNVYLLYTGAIAATTQWIEVEPHIFSLPRYSVKNG